MDRSITQGPSSPSWPADQVSPEFGRAGGPPLRPVPSTAFRLLVNALGLAFVALALVVYMIQILAAPNNLYNHFVWQASAWLEGETFFPRTVHWMNEDNL